ncbi:hypothetical protein K1719_002949 [Acacia pycnantha]|nr:hypothetical protein K1719_002949 [Acacia pycnantha]
MRSVLEKDELDETNSLDMFGNLSVDPKHERKEHLINQPILDEPSPLIQELDDAYTKHKDDSVDAGCLMLVTMLLDLNRDLEHVEASEMIVHPTEMFQCEQGLRGLDSHVLGVSYDVILNSLP